MSELNDDYNLNELEKMSLEGLDHFNNDEAIKSIESEALNNIEEQLPEAKQDVDKSNLLKPIILLAILGGLCFFLFTKFAAVEDEQKIYADNYEAPPFLFSTTERSSDSTENAISNIKNLYTQENYKACIEAITNNNNSLLKQYPDLAIYQGISLLEEGNVNEATNILNSSSTEVEDVRLWYLALAQLSKGDHEATKNTLNSLLALPGNYKKKAAKSILEKLN